MATDRLIRVNRDKNSGSSSVARRVRVASAKIKRHTFDEW